VSRESFRATITQKTQKIMDVLPTICQCSYRLPNAIQKASRMARLLYIKAKTCDCMQRDIGVIRSLCSECHKNGEGGCLQESEEQARVCVNAFNKAITDWIDADYMHDECEVRTRLNKTEDAAHKAMADFYKVAREHVDDRGLLSSRKQLAHVQQENIALKTLVHMFTKPEQEKLVNEQEVPHLQVSDRPENTPVQPTAQANEVSSPFMECILSQKNTEELVLNMLQDTGYCEVDSSQHASVKRKTWLDLAAYSREACDIDPRETNRLWKLIVRHTKTNEHNSFAVVRFFYGVYYSVGQSLHAAGTHFDDKAINKFLREHADQITFSMKLVSDYFPNAQQTRDCTNLLRTPLQNNDDFARAYNNDELEVVSIGNGEEIVPFTSHLPGEWNKQVEWLSLLGRLWSPEASATSHENFNHVVCKLAQSAFALCEAIPTFPWFLDLSIRSQNSTGPSPKRAKHE